jgi:Fe-S-cluster containining protein
MSDKPWYRDGLRFACTGCGQCCTGAPGAVWVTSEEVEKMAQHLKMPVAEFSRRYLRTVGGRLSLNEHPDNYDCVFLKERRCTIYEVRPLQCRTFPWWPGVLTDEASWKAAGKRCEGICDTAPVVAFEEIERNADLHRE